MKSKLRAFISGLLYVVALLSLLGAIMATSRGSLLDFSDLARLILCAFAVLCVVIATLVWKAKEDRGKRKKIIVMIIAIVVIIGGGLIDTFFSPPGRGATEYVSIQFPFSVSDVESVEAYHYYSDPAEAEKKTVTDTETITALYESLQSLMLQDKDIEDQEIHNVAIFRFNLPDGSAYDIVYTGYGVKNGEIKTSGGSNYFTSADLGGKWMNLPGEAIPAEESELPEVSIIPPTKPIVSEVNGNTVNKENKITEQGGSLTEPPELTVACNEKQISALRGTYSWEYQNGDGTSTCIEADSMHPLESKEYMSYLPLAYSAYSATSSFRAHLLFTVLPDEVEIVYWNADCWGNTSAEETVLPVRTIEVDAEDGSWSVDYTADLLPGNNIYEVIAKWSSSEEYTGTAHYSFYTTMGDYKFVPISE